MPKPCSYALYQTHLIAQCDLIIKILLQIADQFVHNNNMKLKTYRAFDDEQVALLRSLLQNKSENKDFATKAKAPPERVVSQPHRPHTRMCSAQATLASTDLNVVPEHAQRAVHGDFDWVPQSVNRVIEATLRRSNVKVRPRRDQIVVVGHIYFKRANNMAVTDTVSVGDQQTKVALVRVDPALEYAFRSRRLGWVALVNSGQAAAWDPVYVFLAEKDPANGSRHLSFISIPGREKAINAALRTGMLCLAVLSDGLSMPRSLNVVKPKTSENLPRKKRLEYVQANISKLPTTHSDGSSLIPIGHGGVPKSQKKKRLNNKSSDKLKPSVTDTVENIPNVSRGKYLGLEWCTRCGGGELPNCSKCDGKGFFDLYEGDKQIDIKLGRAFSMSGTMGVVPSAGRSAFIADHEAVGRSDPLDANRGTSGIRDGSKFGSAPLHDNYDD